MLAPGIVPRSTAVAALLSQQQGAGVGEEESIVPMDLSSGGLAALSSFLRCRTGSPMPVQSAPEINVQRLAELVRLQQRESEDKRKWEDEEEEEEEVVEKEMGVALCHNHNNHSSHNLCRQEVGGRTPRLLVHCIFPEVEVNIF